MADIEYWNHNTAYHPWILSHIRPEDHVIDVGCGDGLLLRRLAPHCEKVTGIEPDRDAAEVGKTRLDGVKNAEILHLPFHDCPPMPADVVIFAASIHHMDFAEAAERAKAMLSPGGRLLIVGLAKPAGLGDHLVEALRILPAKLGSMLHGEKNNGQTVAPTVPPKLSLGEIRTLAARLLPGASIRRGLYYRYLLCWTAPSAEKGAQ